MEEWIHGFDIEVQPIIACFLAMGIAVCAVDMPGTGQNSLPLSKTVEEILNLVIQFLQKNSALQGDSIGFYGLSFGGHWAVKLTLSFCN